MKHRGPFAYACAYMVFLYLPILFLPLFSFNDATVVSFPLKGFSTRWYELLWTIDALKASFWNSIKVAVSTAVISTIFGIFGARAITRYMFPGKGPITAFVMLPLVLPEIIVGIALLVVLTPTPIGGTLLAITLGHVLLCIPFSIAVLVSSFEGFDRSLEEAAMDLGETAWSTFFKVTLPIVAPGIISSLLITFIISLDEFIVAFFLAGVDTTLPIYIWSQLRFPQRIPSVLALGSLLLAASFVLLTIAEVLRRKSQRRTNVEGGMI